LQLPIDSTFEQHLPHSRLMFRHAKYSISDTNTITATQTVPQNHRRQEHLADGLRPIGFKEVDNRVPDSGHILRAAAGS
jgi:hypothetical protein